MSKKIYNKISGLLFERPSYKFHLREIARLAGVHPNSAKSALIKLKKEGIAAIEKRRHITEIFADMGSKSFARKKRLFNFEKICDTGIIEHLERIFEPASISLIGSYSRGEDIEKSDIDIVVADPAKKGVKEKDIARFEDMLKRKIHIIAADYKDMSDEFYINLINGMLLYGYLKRK